MVFGSATVVAVVVMWAAVAMNGGGVGAASVVGAPAPAGVDCTSLVLSLSDCLTFVEEGSKEGKPTKKCCSALTKVVKEKAECLCEAFKESASFGVTLNMTKALGLPSACKVATPPVSKCNIAIAGVPNAAPAPSPAILGNGVGVPGGSPALAPGLHSGAQSFPAPAAALLICVALTVSSVIF